MTDDVTSWATGRLLSHVSRDLERRWNAHLDAWGLNHASMPVLLALLAQNHSQRELAAASDVTEQTMSRVVARLERLGYVERTSDAHDARRRLVHLTDSGRTVVLQAAQRGPGEEMATRGLDHDQVAALREILVTMVRAGSPEHPGIA